jgi:hypothetical protein
MENKDAGTRSGETFADVSSLLIPRENVVQIWKGYHPSRDSAGTSVGTRMLRGERNVGAPDPALLVLTDKRILVLDRKGVFKRKYVLSESSPLEKIGQVEKVGVYRTDIRIRGDWGYFSYVEFRRPIRVDEATLEESGNEDPLGAIELITTGSERAKLTNKK